MTQLEGVLLLVVFVGYTLFLFQTDWEAVKRRASSEADDDDQKRYTRPRFHWKPVGLSFGIAVHLVLLALVWYGKIP